LKVTTMLLCDHAEELGGKLYIMGGGWSKLFTPEQPTNMALAIKLSVPWDEADRPHDIVVRLRKDEDTETFKTDEGEDIQIRGELEAQPSAELQPGSSYDVSLAPRFQGLVLEPGSYVWELLVDDNLLESMSFEVVSAG
jgi:hypothetical protein